MFETETFGLCLVRKLNWGRDRAPTGPPVATLLASSAFYEICLEICQNIGPPYICLPKTKEQKRDKSVNLKQSLE